VSLKGEENSVSLTYSSSRYSLYWDATHNLPIYWNQSA